MEKIISFIKDGHQMLPVEVELSLSPGLPKVNFTGMADLSIKESVTRLKTAFEQNGFVWPRKKQITINLKPAYIKKSSNGLDLAISCALLMQTKQWNPREALPSKPYFIYGEVGLNGEIDTPEDINQINARPILTGQIKNQYIFDDLYSVKTLKDLKNPVFLKAKPFGEILKRPALPPTKFSKNASLLLKLCAYGEHSMLLAGEAGSGKTTLAQHIPCLLPEPSEEEFKTSKRISNNFNKNLSWRPFVSPHHSTPPLSMIGGGFPPFFGEISRAHGGVLFLDEYLEFQYKVQEALREPMERGNIFISRKGESICFPARFILVAAANLCPCGSFVPGLPAPCSYSLRRCRSHLERLSGPMLDRFDILSLSSFWRGPMEVSLDTLLEEVKLALEVRKKRKQTKPNARLQWEELSSQVDPFTLKHIMPSETGSKRRRIALLRAARSLADLDKREKINSKDIQQAAVFTLKPFNELKLQI